MIELEVQVLSERREGLIVDIGRSLTDLRFTLLRHRLVQAPNGALLTMILRGPPRRRNALEAALEDHARVISYVILEAADGDMHPHFAAPPPPVKLPPMPAQTEADRAARRGNPFLSADEAPVEADEAATAPAPAMPEPEPPTPAEPELSLEEELQQFRLPTGRAPPAGARQAVRTPEPVRAAADAFAEQTPLDPDEAAVERAMADIALSYPDILPALSALQQAVAAGAREPSLQLAGQHTGAVARERQLAGTASLGLVDALDTVGLPALAELVTVERTGQQLHLRDSPLCTDDGVSGCAFFTGFLEGLLGPVIASGALSIFPVCCRACGADECVLALSD